MIVVVLFGLVNLADREINAQGSLGRLLLILVTQTLIFARNSDIIRLG